MTKETSTLIDIIASTHHFNVVKTIVLANGLSDHDLTGIIRKLNIAKYVPRQFITRNYKFYNKDNFKKDLTNIQLGFIIPARRLEPRLE